MKRLLLLIALLLPCMAVQGQDKLTVVFWNLENFFDFRADSTSTSELEFTPTGERRWSKRRFYAKCNAVAKTLLLLSDTPSAFPDIAAFCELENAFVLKQLTTATALRKLPLGIVHFDSADPRGIDCGLIFRKDRLRLESSRAVHLTDSSGRIIPTRDILVACFETKDSCARRIALCANHHPSKYGGGASSNKRHIAMNTMFALCDSLMAAGIGNIVCIGDFNESPGDDPLEPSHRQMHDLSAPLYSKGTGSIKFNGRWALIDRCFVSENLAGCTQMKVLALPHLSTRDSSFAGLKPLRTYSGPRYLGGVSDHYPIETEIVLESSR